jgi:hypothetical protein
MSLMVTTANAWTVNDPSQRAGLIADFQALPPCERVVIDKRLKHVVFTNKLKFPMWGDSYGFGYMLLSNDLDDDALVARIFYHECGHFFDWQEHLSDREEFSSAVFDDFLDMTPKKAYQNDYLREPKEAFAELFSAHFLPLTYDGTDYKYDLKLLPRSEKVFQKELVGVCPEGGD